jgi:hypothetical protein
MLFRYGSDSDILHSVTWFLDLFIVCFSRKTEHFCWGNGICSVLRQKKGWCLLHWVWKNHSSTRMFRTETYPFFEVCYFLNTRRWASPGTRESQIWCFYISCFGICRAIAWWQHSGLRSFSTWNIFLYMWPQRTSCTCYVVTASLEHILVVLYSGDPFLRFDLWSLVWW